MHTICRIDGLVVRPTILLRAVPVVLILVLMPPPASADPPIIVGNGAADSCVEGAADMPGSLRWAVSVASALGGGAIRFDCGKSPVAIPLHPGVVLPNHTTIDGGGLITLSHAPVTNNQLEMMFFIAAESTAALKNLTIFWNRQGPGPGPGLPVPVAARNEGTLVVDNVTFTRLAHAVINVGSLSLNKSTIQQSFHFVDEAPAIINVGGDVTVKMCLFVNNGLGAMQNSGTLDVANSVFSGNRGDIVGGAIRNDGELNVKNSSFSGNTAFFGGALFNTGRMTIKNSIVSGNDGSGSGGGVYNTGTATIENSTVSGNRAGFPTQPGNGGGLFNAGAATLLNTTFSENQASLGGGIYNTGDGLDGTLELRNGRITSNTATVDGGGIFLSQSSPAPSLFHTKVFGNTPNDIGP